MPADVRTGRNKDAPVPPAASARLSRLVDAATRDQNPQPASSRNGTSRSVPDRVFPFGVTPAAPSGNGSAARHAFELVGLRWNWLILEAVLEGVHRFSDLQRELGIPRKMLARRLTMLVAHGVLERRRYQSRPDRYEYRATAKGRALRPALGAFASWAERHRSRRSSSNGRLPIGADGVFPYGLEPVRRTANGSVGRRELELLGLRWNLLIQEVLGIPPKTLARRLPMLVAHRIVECRRDGVRPDRWEYRPTDNGRDLLPALLALARWGERHLSESSGSAPDAGAAR